MPDPRAPTEIWLETCLSTQQELKRLTQEGCAARSFVVSKTQTGGRGRGDHTWKSAEGNLHLSYLEELPRPLSITWTPILVGIAVVRVLQAQGRDVAIKWPNDLWYEGAKCGGILCEAIGSDRAVIGIGLNCKIRPVDAEISASVLQLDPEALVKPLCQEISLLFSQARNLDPEAISASFFVFSLLQRGDEISYVKQGKPQLAQVNGLGSQGELLVQVIQPAPASDSLYSEEIQLVRKKT